MSDSNRMTTSEQQANEINALDRVVETLTTERDTYRRILDDLLQELTTRHLPPGSWLLPVRERVRGALTAKSPGDVHSEGDHITGEAH